mgnify:CR=1 FL=1
MNRTFIFWIIIIYQSFIDELYSEHPNSSAKPIARVKSSQYICSTAYLWTDKREKLQELEQSYVLYQLANVNSGFGIFHTSE